MAQSSLQILTTQQIIDNLTSSGVTTSALSANQGYVLEQNLLAIGTGFTQLYNNSVSGSSDVTLLEIPKGSSTSGVAIEWDHTTGQIKLVNNSSSLTYEYTYSLAWWTNNNGTDYRIYAGNSSNSLASSATNYFGNSTATSANTTLNVTAAGNSFVMLGLVITESTNEYNIPIICNTYESTNSKNVILICSNA